MRLFGKIDNKVNNKDRPAFMKPRYFDLIVFPTTTEKPKFFCRRATLTKEVLWSRLKLG